MGFSIEDLERKTYEIRAMLPRDRAFSVNAEAPGNIPKRLGRSRDAEAEQGAGNPLDAWACHVRMANRFYDNAAIVAVPT
ncbi:hypothetical protein [Dyella flagellata]|uniref:Uncharacterized protein n=1 Tax=Dyella flagellata TaxID=1867833 RepID=A0ABQ5XEV3_9GAMM|nr:hypothetical protein [Dyella flagellata]GLQ89761.1 hypothetical protein GCM10007898_33360 [Dyella flagellata]